MKKVSSKDFEINFQDLNHILMMDFKGSFSETAILKNIDLAGKLELHLNFDGITYINSFGVKSWVFWMWEIEKNFPNLKVLIYKCPVVMWRQILTIANFVPKITQIKSLYVPYFCDTCKQNSAHLIDSKPFINLDDKTLNKRLSTNCLQCQKPLVLDASLETINKFINKYKPD